MQIEQTRTDVDLDLGLLSVFNSSHIDFKNEKGTNPSENPELDAQLDKISKERFGDVIGALLEIKKSEDELRDAKKLDLQIHDFEKPEFNVALPAPVTILPRFRPLPKKKALTKYEKWAKEKGIQKKKKRSKLVWDETTKDWVFRWGAKGRKKINEKYDIIREVSYHIFSRKLTLRRCQATKTVPLTHGRKTSWRTLSSSRDSSWLKSETR